MTHDGSAMRSKPFSVVVVTCLGLSPTLASQPLHSTISIESVRIEVTWVSSQAELDARRREYGTPRPAGTVIPENLQAFSVLGKRDGELVCLIFAPKPARFDDRVNTSLGHELLHCFGFSHKE
jgi:hypothetical protein